MKIFKLHIALLFVTLSVSAQVDLWYQKPSGKLGAALSVKVNQQRHIFASVLDKGIYRSLDSGTTWAQVAPFAAGAWTFDFDSQGKIFASLWTKGIYVSTNNGDSWNQVESNMLNADIRFINSYDQIFIEAGGKTFRTTNDGARWLEMKSVNVGTGMSLPNKKMYAAKNTLLAVSNDNGATWNSQQIISSAYALAVDTLGRIFIGTYCDETSRQPSILAYDSLESQWTRTGPKSTVNALVRHKNGRIFAATHDSGCYIHDDTSDLWVPKNEGLTTTKIYSIAFLSDSIVVAGTLDGIFFSKEIVTTPLPVELIAFSARRFGSAVELFWMTATETNNYGFEIEKKIISADALRGGKNNSSVWKTIGFMQGAGTKSSPTEYRFADNVSSGAVRYRLKQIDRSGEFHYSQEVEVAAAVPAKFALAQNFPNPFNPATTISFSIPQNFAGLKDQQGLSITLKVYDILGKEITELVRQQLSAGEYAVQFNASQLPSGIYFYTLAVKENDTVVFSKTQRMTLLK